MTAKLQTTNPDEIEFTLTLTMPLRDWRRLQGQLQTDFPSWQLSAEITGMVIQAQKVFYPEVKES
jgi:hypothetical protein